MARNVLLSHYWQDPATSIVYGPGDVATVENDVAWRLANGGIGRYTDDPSSGGTSPGGSGADGREVELKNSGTHIQWRYVGQVSWTNLVPLENLRGPKGDQGIRGETGATGASGSGGGGALSEDLLARITALEAGSVILGADGAPTP